MNEIMLPETNANGLLAVEKAKNMVIKSNEDFQAADSFCASLKLLEKEVDDGYDGPIKTAYQAHKELVAKKAQYAAPIQEARKIIKEKLFGWERAQEEIRRKGEERLRIEAKKKADDEALKRAQEAEAQGENEIAEAIIEESSTAPAPAVVVPKSVPKRATTLRTIKKFRITNPALIKREFLCPDEVKIGGVVRSLGVSATQVVGGIEVYEVPA